MTRRAGRVHSPPVNATNPPDPLPAPQEPVPDPERAGRIRGGEIMAGFAIGLAISWVLRLLLLGVTWLAYPDWNVEEMWAPFGIFVVFAPTAALCTALVWAIRTRRKPWAIGMAIYAGVGGLLLGPTIVGLGFTVAICGKW
jgi:hypothetical protein